MIDLELVKKHMLRYVKDVRAERIGTRPLSSSFCTLYARLVRVGIKNPKIVWWNDEIKTAVMRKKSG